MNLGMPSKASAASSSSAICRAARPMLASLFFMLSGLVLGADNPRSLSDWLNAAKQTADSARQAVKAIQPAAAATITPGQADAGAAPAAPKETAGATPNAKPAALAAPASQDISAQRRKLEQDCRDNAFFSTYHDCSCAASRLAHLPQPPGHRVELGVLPAGECTAQRQVIYDANFQTCAGLKSQRKDWESMCTCSTAKMVDAYLAKPVLNTRYIRDLHGEALKACGILDRPKAAAR